MQEKNKKKIVSALVLAAGSSKRMGRHKIFLNLKNRPMFFWCLDALRHGGVSDITMVLGNHYQDALAYLNLLDNEKGLAVVINHNFAQGMGSSIVTGMDTLSYYVDGVILALADMPFVTANTIARLVEAFEKAAPDKTIIAPFFQGKRGNPVLMASCHFEELRALKGDHGARELLLKYRSQILPIQIDSPEVLIDIDTEKDLSDIRHIL